MATIFSKGIQEFIAAQDLIHGGVKRMNLLDEPDKYPIYFEQAKGCHVWDIDGNKYVDFISSKGATILGYSFDEVNKKVIKQIENSNILPLNNPIQNKLAQLFKQTIPCAERVRFFRTGSCATSALVRLAREYTKKEVILTSGYHGWHDWTMMNRKGVPEYAQNVAKDFKYDLVKLEQLLAEHKDNVAAVFITPEPCFWNKSFYEDCFKLARQYNALFLLDEVKTGFRADLHGYQNLIGITPDAATFSKAMSNGFPISAVAGRKDLMAVEDITHLSGTFDIESSAMVAAISTLEYMIEHKVHNEILSNGRYFSDSLNEMFKQSGFPAMCKNDDPSTFHIIFASEDMGRKFYRECAQRGVTFYCFNNVNMTLAHTKEVLDSVLDICRAVIATIPNSDNCTVEKEHVDNYLRAHRMI